MELRKHVNEDDAQIGKADADDSGVYFEEGDEDDFGLYPGRIQRVGEVDEGLETQDGDYCDTVVDGLGRSSPVLCITYKVPTKNMNDALSFLRHGR